MIFLPHYCTAFPNYLLAKQVEPSDQQVEYKNKPLPDLVTLSQSANFTVPQFPYQSSEVVLSISMTDVSISQRV